MQPDPLTRLVRGTLADAAPDGVPGLRTLVGMGLAGALQGPRPGSAPDADTTRAPTGAVRHPGDPGLCGPGSASWQVLADVAGLAAGNRALLLQTLHPLAMAGVHDHSDYAEDPFGRLHRTSQWVVAVTFGATPEALRVSRMVRGLHRRVIGTAPDGRPYAASDPELLAWVSMTFTGSLLAADRAFGARPVDAATADRFVLEQSRVGALLDPRVDLSPYREDQEAQAALRRWELDLPLLDDGLLPHDTASLQRCLARYDRVLERGEHARQALEFLRRPGLPTDAMPTYRAIQLGAVATLPGHVRKLLGWGWVRGPAAVLARRQAGALLTGLRLGLGRSPALRAATARVQAG